MARSRWILSPLHARPLSLLAFSAAAAAMISAAPAEACSYHPRFPGFAEPVFASPDLSVEAARLELSCRDRGGDAACTLEARYRVRNAATSERVSTGAVFSGHFNPSAALETPSGEIPLPLTPSTFADIDSLVRGGTFLRDATHRVSTFRLSLQGAEARELRIRATFTIARAEDPCAVEGVFGRHPIAAFGRRHRSYALRYVQAISTPPRRPYVLEVRLRRPASWEGDIGAPSAVPVQTSTREGFSIDVGTLRATTDHDEVWLGLAHPRSFVLNGGPFVGAGYAFSRAPGLRFRVGYELAAPGWLLDSIAIESDWQQRLSVVPAIEAITSRRAMSPIVFGAGVGVPIGVRPEARIGARAQASASGSFITVRGSLDVLPALSAGLPLIVEGTIGGQLSL